jgi:hypothetical protein
VTLRPVALISHSSLCQEAFMADEKQWVLEAVNNRFADVDRYDVATARVVETKPFLLGSLNRVDFKRKDGSAKTVYAWAPELDPKSGRLRGGIEIFDNTDQLIPFVSRAPTADKASFLLRMTPVDIISGVIAVLMTITAIFVVVHQVIYQDKVEIPQLLSASITMILGFYFGRATTDQTMVSK